MIEPMPILEYPDPRLREVAIPVEVFDEEVAHLVEVMKLTMTHAKGVGLAATQVGVNKRIFVTGSFGPGLPTVFVNPEIIKAEYPDRNTEGCLSFPGKKLTIIRPSMVRVKAFDQFGVEFNIKARNWFAVCIQHEIDHLNGVVFLDRQ